MTRHRLTSLAKPNPDENLVSPSLQTAGSGRRVKLVGPCRRWQPRHHGAVPRPHERAGSGCQVCTSPGSQAIPLHFVLCLLHARRSLTGALAGALDLWLWSPAVKQFRRVFSGAAREASRDARRTGCATSRRVDLGKPARARRFAITLTK
jgi:hypothetical protein